MTLTLPLSWPLAVLAGLLVVVAGEVAYRLIFAIVARAAARSSTSLDDVLIRRLRFPARGLVFLLGANATISLGEVEHGALLSAVLLLELGIGCVLVVEILETAIIHYWLAERRGIQVPTVVRSLLLVIVYTVAAFSIIGAVTGLNVAPLLATSTVVTVVLGLALQDTLGNLFAGLALHIERPFGVGDWILVDGVEGHVVSMGWRSVQVQTFSVDIVVFPNSFVTKARVQNFYAPTRITSRTVELLVRLDAPPAAVEEAVLEAARATERVHADPPPKVWLVGHTPLSQRYVLRFWMEDFRAHDDVESDLLKALWTATNARGIALPHAAAIAGVDGASVVPAGAAAREG